MNVKPLGDRILIKIKESETKTAGGIIIPQTAQEKTQTGVVVAVGTDTDVIKVKAGEPIRIFVVNAGPNVFCTFHVVGAIFDAAYVGGNPQNKQIGVQSISIGAGDGCCVEFTLDEPGLYTAVNHAFGHAAHGAIALLQAE